eukprot:scaffold6880_cov30-Tisochrysis_lutea.AAC.3
MGDCTISDLPRSKRQALSGRLHNLRSTSVEKVRTIMYTTQSPIHLGQKGKHYQVYGTISDPLRSKRQALSGEVGREVGECKKQTTLDADVSSGKRGELTMRAEGGTTAEMPCRTRFVRCSIRRKLW